MHRVLQAAAVHRSGEVLHSARRRAAGPPDRQQRCWQCQCHQTPAGQPDRSVCVSVSVVAAHTWTYPSEQMFFNAMRRKGWVPREDDMPRCGERLCLRTLARGTHADSHLAACSVVAIHNTVNERAWREVLAWEALHSRCERSARPTFPQSKLRPPRYAPPASAPASNFCASAANHRTTARRPG